MGYTYAVTRVSVDVLGPLNIVPGPIVLCSIQSTYVGDTQAVGTPYHMSKPPKVLSVMLWVCPGAHPGPQGSGNRLMYLVAVLSTGVQPVWCGGL